MIPGGNALSHKSSHVHAGAPESPDDPPTLQYARSPQTIADVQRAHAHVIAAHYSVATAHHNAATDLWGSDNKRAERHTAKAEKHEDKIHDHQRRIEELENHKHPIRVSAADHEIKEANEQTAALYAAADSINAAAAAAASQ